MAMNTMGDPILTELAGSAAEADRQHDDRGRFDGRSEGQAGQ